MQLLARKAMQNGLMKYDRCAVSRARDDRRNGRRLGRAARRGQGLGRRPEWRLAVVLESSKAGLSIGLQPGREASGALKAERDRASWRRPT